MIAAAAVFFALVAEAMGVYVVAEWLNAGFDEPERKAPSAVAFAFVALAGFAVPRALAVLGRFDARGAAAAVALTYAIVYGAIRIEFAADVAIWDLGWAFDFIRDAETAVRDGRAELLGSVLLVLTWARAAWRSNTGIETEMLPRTFAPSFVMVTVVVMLALAGDRSGIVARGVLAFYAFGLLSLACAQLSLSGATIGEVRAGGITTVLLAGTAAVTLLGVAVVWVVFGLLWDIAGPFVTGPLASGIQRAIVLVLTPPAWLLAQFFSWLFGFAGGSGEIEPDAIFTPGGVTGEEPIDEEPSAFNRILGYGLRALAVVGLLGVLAAIVILAVRWQRRRAAARDGEGEVAAAGSLAGDLRAALRSMFGRRGGTTVVGEGVTRLYLEVLARAEHAGIHREPSQTPHELAPSLHDTFHTEVTDEITAAFEDARYGGREPDAETFAVLQSRWRAARSDQ